ncbi:MAG: hypothetical protein P4L84_13715 [Isosphaeraceae bacterium]|nr:hypothetical protein [Isosphaeraceae bacterium]
MPPKRAGARTASTTASGPSPLLNAILLLGSVGYALAILVSRGRVGWPPHQLLASSATVAGCLALVGPIVLARAASAEGGLGELLWMTGGLLIWVFDFAALVRGQWETTAWATPLDSQTMGLIILAVLVAGWRSRMAVWSWSWTNVTGWVLGLFWVGIALASWVPSRIVTAATH